jgi:cytochrome c biogenesis protein CcmG, thiol:disulfide interchange protein DsbE
LRTIAEALNYTGQAVMRAARYWVLAIFLALGALLAVGLTLNPRELPSALVDRPVPKFELAAVRGRSQGLASADLRGQVSVVNVFASWCKECRDEHPLWMQLASRRAFLIHGLNYRDRPVDAARWLDALGDPYARTGADLDGRIGIEWGVYGVPETFVIDKRGVIRHKIIGPITPQIVEQRLLPLLRRLQAEPA